MRSLSILVLVAVPCAMVHAQWTNNTLLNTAVRSGAGVDAVTPLLSDGPDGSTYVSWFDNQPGGYQLHMQRLDADGYALWDPAGITVSDHPQNSALFRYDLKTDMEGNAIVSFQDERSGQLDMVVYKVAPDGTQLWGTDGISTTSTGSTQGLGPAIGVLPNNDAVIAWNANDGSAKWVAIQYVFEDGSLPPGSPLTITGPAGYSRPRIIAASDGGFFVQYVEEVGNFPFTCTMRARRFDALGMALDDFIVSTKTIPFFFFPDPIADGHDGFYVAFNTGNPGNAALTDVFLQRLRADGSTWSATGTELLVGTTTQRFGGPVAVLDDLQGVMVPVQVTNAGQTAGGLALQRVDTAGADVLGPTGVELVAQSADIPSPDGVASTSDGCIVVYSRGGFGNEHIHALRTDVNGLAVWSPEATVLCSVNSNKDDADCGTFMDDQLVVVWNDDRAGSGIFAQNVQGDGTTGIPTAVNEFHTSLGTARLEQNPASTACILFGKERPGNQVITLTDASGRVQFTERIWVAEGLRHVLPVDDLSKGVYSINLSGPSGGQVLRWAKE